MEFSLYFIRIKNEYTIVLIVNEEQNNNIDLSFSMADSLFHVTFYAQLSSNQITIPFNSNYMSNQRPGNIQLFCIE